MKKATKAARKIAIALVGFPLLIIGLILIPLPGPGILVSLGGLVILATEFDWAQKYADKCRAVLKKIVDKAKDQAAEKPKAKNSQSKDQSISTKKST